MRCVPAASEAEERRTRPSTGWLWHERFAWHDARGLADSLPREALFEPEPSLESGAAKRRLHHLVDVSGLLAELVAIAPRPALEHELLRLHDRAYVQRMRRERRPRR